MIKNLKYIAFAILVLIPTSAFCETSTGNVNLLWGHKYLGIIQNENDWEPVEHQSEIGLAFDTKRESWPVSLTMEYLLSKDDGDETGHVKVEGKTTEFALGLRWIKEIDKGMNIFISGGIAHINGKVKTTTESISVLEKDSGFGPWLGAGFYFNLVTNLNLGVQFRWSYAEVEIADVTADAGGTHLPLLFVGFHW